MKRGIIKAIVCVISFVLSILIISSVMNRGNSDITMEMSEASYPLVYVNYEGEHINCLHGYAQEMDVSFMRDTITPLGENRELSLYIDTFNTSITSIAYEVRSTDGTRLIESTQLYDYIVQTAGISADIQLKDLIDPDEEYELIILLNDVQGRQLRYYTRVVLRSDNHIGEEIYFARNFHEKTFDRENANEIAQYLETNESGDNTTYSYVNIHSSFRQITWGDLTVEKITEPQLSITELFPQTARITISYYVNVLTETGERRCRVDEYYRLRYGIQRIYLLNYERTMTEVFEMDLAAFNNNKIDLGIRNADVEIAESEDGGAFAFVSANRLFCYNSNNNRFSQLFAFYTKDHEDERTFYNQNDIRVLSVDEAGNVQFAVYGYMNRGTHEGKMGVAVYLFNGVLNTIEEEAFIPYNRSFATLESDVERLMYLNSNEELFVYLGGSIFCINLNDNSYTVVAKDLAQESFKVSESGRIVVWPEGEDPDRSQNLNVMNLNTKVISTIDAGAGHYIRPLGFMEEDLIYGLVNQSDLFVDNAGSLVTPMFCINISSEPDNKISMQYQKDDIYIMNVILSDNQITMERARKTPEGVYVATAADQIMSNTSELKHENTIDVAATKALEKIVQIAAKSNIATRSLKFMTPKEVMYEGGHEVNLEYPESMHENYYVYGSGGILGVYAKESEAVNIAEQESGTVLNGYGDYVWIKANRNVSNQIMKITATMQDENNSSLAVCLDTMLLAEGISRNSQYLLDQGATALSVLQDNMPEDCEILDLSGCSLDAVLYYVNRDIPVMAILNDRSAVLIIGFNELNTVIMDPATGTIYKKGINDSTDWFNSNGNQFITYIN
ncbi:MAG: hypothetical protein PUE95_02715 [Lachnospiraceae bacterium]|nr:hypothetical protein [Lachnospiraceae bacterium]